ncbi:S-layer homology domain-containing protein [Paenibacillus cymbidii]|uniref:S-layer homology domain-containing protein n=1 Tax=Paenibacillus cymbidii TaxID=1639034 RepID=UPI001080FEB4|nr:S-layer homology domain-containing protein [Paenibacillus cymbidii]
MVGWTARQVKKRAALALLALLVALHAFAGVAAAARTDSAAPTTEEAIAGAAAWLQRSGAELSDWSAFALARAGYEVPQAYKDKLEQTIGKTGGKFASVTDAERYALVVKAIGENPASFAGVNLIRAIAAEGNIAKSGAMGAIFGLLALNSGSHTLPEGAVNTPDSLAKWLLAQQAADGGWSYITGEASTVDVTAMAVAALAPLYGQQEEVKQAADKAVAWMAAQQKDNGGFDGMSNSSESAAQAIVGLTSLGLDPAGETFAKQASLLEHLASYRQADGGYAHAAGGASSAMSTEQALEALVAYRLYAAKQGTLFHHIRTNAAVSLRIEGPQSTLATGDASASNAMEALQKFAGQQKLDLDIVTASFGSYVNGINGIAASGFDGWQYAVERGGVWVYPQVGMSDFELQPNDRLIVYYGGTTKFVHDVNVKPAAPKAGQPFTVTVYQSSWDWTANKEAVEPAAGATVQIGGKKATTDERGVAAFDGVSAAGAAAVTITGYQEGAAPSLLKAVASLNVIPAGVNVTLHVEGPKGPIAEGVVTAVYALDALQRLAAANGVNVEMKSSAYGNYVAAIGDAAADAADGWMFAVLRDGAWEYPSLAMDQFDLRPNDRIYIYYGYSAAYVHEVAVAPEQPKAGESIQLAVTQETWDWTKNERVIKPGTGLAVEVDGKSYTTDAAGKATIAGGLPNGNYTIVVTGYQPNGSPSVVRYAQPLNLYADYEQAADWAKPYIAEASKLGLLQGTGGEGFSPNKELTRAELAASLVRALGIPVDGSAKSAFADVPADSWYAGYIEAARKQGIVQGVDDDRFAPEAKVTREQLALMLTRALQLQAEHVAVPRFRDAAEAADYSQDALLAVEQAGLMTGVDDTHFAPKATVTREMLAVVAVRAYESVR